MLSSYACAIIHVLHLCFATVQPMVFARKGYHLLRGWACSEAGLGRKMAPCCSPRCLWLQRCSGLMGCCCWCRGEVASLTASAALLKEAASRLKHRHILIRYSVNWCLHDQHDKQSNAKNSASDCMMPNGKHVQTIC